MFHLIWAIIFIIKLYKSVANAPNLTSVAQQKKRHSPVPQPHDSYFEVVAIAATLRVRSVADFTIRKTVSLCACTNTFLWLLPRFHVPFLS